MSKPHKADPQHLSGVELARIISSRHVKDRSGRPVTLTPGALTHWVAGGCPRNDDGKYHMADVMAWLAGERGLAAHRPPGEMDEMDKAKLADKLEQTKARRQARLAAEKKLISIEDVHQDWMRLLHGVKSGLTTLARVLVKEVAGQPEPVVKARIDERVNDTLKAFAEGWEDEEG